MVTQSLRSFVGSIALGFFGVILPIFGLLALVSTFDKIQRSGNGECDIEEDDEKPGLVVACPPGGGGAGGGGPLGLLVRLARAVKKWASKLVGLGKKLLPGRRRDPNTEDDPTDWRSIALVGVAIVVLFGLLPLIRLLCSMDRYYF
jgi:hypothetical protein